MFGFLVLVNFIFYANAADTNDLKLELVQIVSILIVFCIKILLIDFFVWGSFLDMVTEHPIGLTCVQTIQIEIHRVTGLTEESLR